MSDNKLIGSEHQQLGTEPVLRLLLKYAVPSIVSMLVMSLYNIVDQLFIGWGVGYLGNGATTVAFPIVTVGLALALLIGSGSSAYISLELGRGNSKNANRTLGNALTLVIIIGITLTIVLLLFLEPILRAAGGASDAIMPYAMDYTSIIVIGFPFAMIGPAISNIIRADGSPRYSMVATLSGAVLNTVLDPVFIFGFGMGVKGAAWATVFSQMVSAAMILNYIFRHGRVLKFSVENMKLDMGVVKKQLSYGSASFVNQVNIIVVNVVSNNSLTHYGAQSVYGSDIPLAAMGIVMKITAILISCILGIAIGAQPILGYNYGAGNFDRVKRTYRTEICTALALSSVACLLFVTVPHVFIAAFGDSDTVFNEFAAAAMRTALCCVFVTGFQIPSANYFQAVGKPLKSMSLTMTRSLICQVTYLLILPVFFGVNGILFATPATDITATVVTTVFIIREMRHLNTTDAVKRGLYGNISGN